MCVFCHLHNHTKFSQLDGATTAKPLMKHLKGLGMDTYAKTDHGTIAGIFDFVEEGTKEGIKVICGIEIYEVNDCREKFIGEFADCRDPEGKERKVEDIPDETAEKRQRYWHLTLLAKNKAGYDKLVKLCTAGNTKDTYFYKPRVDRKILEEICTGDDLLMGTGCAISRMSRTCMHSDEMADLEKDFAYYRKIFGEKNIFVEIMSTSYDKQPGITQKMIPFAEKMGLPICCTNDTHYIEKSHSRLQDILVCIGTGQKIDGERKFKFEGDSYYIRSEEEMREAFKKDGFDIKQEWLDNTRFFADKCEHANYAKYSEFRLPKYDVSKSEFKGEFSSWLKKYRSFMEDKHGVPSSVIDEALENARS